MDADTLARAKSVRLLDKRILTMCRCAWPIQTYRNGSGHASDCPAHTEHERTRTKRNALIRGSI